MSLIHKTTVIAGVAALLAGCSETGRVADPQASLSGPQNATPSNTGATASGAPQPIPVALTAACPLLSAAELKRLLGGSGSQTTVTATEGTPDPSAASMSYTCTYGSNGRNPFALSVSEVTAGGSTPASEIAAISDLAKSKQQTPESVAGVGEAAVFYSLPDNTSVLASAKQSQGKLRWVVFAGPAILAKQKFVDVEQLVLGRI
jgi:hypothetical protein